MAVYDTIKRVKPTLARAIGSWFACAALYAFSSGPCPFCGKADCPGGPASAGIVGGLIGIGVPFLAKLTQRKGPAASSPTEVEAASATADETC